MDIGNPDKVLFDAAGVTKWDLAEHCVRAAPRILPHVRERPMAVQRFPDGVGGEGFIQKKLPEYAPGWVRHVTVGRERGGTVTMPVFDDAATLAWFAGQAVITLHPWLSRRSALRHPDRIIFDLDPPGDDFEPVRRAAHDLHGLLTELRLPAYLMTTGSRGVHVVLPLRPAADFDEVRDVARGIADTLAARHPDRLTTEVRKEKRRGRLFIDMLRNAYAQHAVAPYAVRPKPSAPVATPLAWDELDDIPNAGHWTVRTIASRLDGPDPWAGMVRHARTLQAVRRAVRSLTD
ncbi:MAG: hypothetical protein GEV11_14120 [Streptosporangiales bacterium]|nr:hypothetical protein [Streptosporangiales bacterium]